jgi:predicted enzyme related to lactoylglutathione lyase
VTTPAEETSQERTDARDGAAGEPRVFRVGGISYVRIPARDVRQSAAFYQAVFGWSVSGDPDSPSFADGTGHVIGHWRTDLPVAGEAGVLPYIYVERVDDTLWQITEHGGDVVRTPYPEGDLWVATFRDPAGNVLGVWQRGPRQ